MQILSMLKHFNIKILIFLNQLIAYQRKHINVKNNINVKNINVKIINVKNINLNNISVKHINVKILT